VSETPEHRAGFVVLGGRSNVGKSTLLNRMVGQKVAIVSPRPQTTRRRIIGVRNEPGAQFIFVDTPGIHEAPRELNRRMVDTARRALGEAEVVLAVVEAAEKLGADDRAALAELGALKAPIVVAINKIDRVARPSLLPLIDEIRQLLPAAEIVPVSARTGENVDELIETIRPMLRAGPALMTEDEYTDQTERMLAEEVIREKIFLRMRQEIPFSTAVKVESFEEVPERKLRRIAAVIIVERESHKGMVIGAGGRNLKEIASAARLELEQILGSRVFLEVVVKVEPDWTKNPRKVAEYGL
jgi:GTP-binding protein Era